MVKTFTQIIDTFELWCNNHAQINEFGWGQVSTISTINHNFIMLFLQPKKTKIRGHELIINFDLLVFDILRQDHSNKKYIMNETLLVGLDFINHFFDNEDEYGFFLNEKNIDGEFFTAKFDDYTAGHIWNIDIIVENRMDLCEIPVNKEINTYTYQGNVTTEEIEDKDVVYVGYSLAFSIGSLEPENPEISGLYWDDDSKKLRLIVPGAYTLISLTSLIINDQEIPMTFTGGFAISVDDFETVPFGVGIWSLKMDYEVELKE